MMLTGNDALSIIPCGRSALPRFRKPYHKQDMRGVLAPPRRARQLIRQGVFAIRVLQQFCSMLLDGRNLRIKRTQSPVQTGGAPVERRQNEKANEKYDLQSPSASLISLFWISHSLSLEGCRRRVFALDSTLLYPIEHPLRSRAPGPEGRLLPAPRHFRLQRKRKGSRC